MYIKNPKIPNIIIPFSARKKQMIFSKANPLPKAENSKFLIISSVVRGTGECSYWKNNAYSIFPYPIPHNGCSRKIQKAFMYEQTLVAKLDSIRIKSS